MRKTAFYRMLISPFYAGYFLENGTLHKGSHRAMITMEEHRKMKTILGVHERLQPKRHLFPYTGVIHCLQCNSLITAYLSTNRYGKGYSYYRCLRCRDHNVSETIIQSKINLEAKRIYVVEPDFRIWAKEALDRYGEEERGTDDAVREQQVASLASLDRQIEALLIALTKGLVDDVEYAKRKRALMHERTELQENLSTWQGREERARKTMDNLLAFVSHVGIWIEKGTVQERKACLRSFGSNFLLDRKNLLWEPHPLLIPIRENYNRLSTEYWQIKHNKTLSESTKSARLERVRSTWSGMWYLNLTLCYEEGLDFPFLLPV